MRFVLKIAVTALFLFSAGHFAAAQQWVVFHVSPQNAMVTVDGERTLPVRQGTAQIMLPAGSHKFVCESPFYESVCGDFTIIDKERTDVEVTLQPEFSYLVISCKDKKVRTFVDGRSVGYGPAETGKITPGEHYVLLVRDSLCLYRASVVLERGEKRTISVGPADYAPVPLVDVLAASGISMSEFLSEGKGTENQEAKGLGSLNIHSNVAGAEVVVNGIRKGTTPCIVRPLQAGLRYRVTLRLHGCKDVTKMVRVKDGDMTDVRILMKKNR